MSFEAGLGTGAQACLAMGWNRRSFYRSSQEYPRSLKLRQQIIDKSQDQAGYGYRRVTALLRRDGNTVNEKGVQRVWRMEGLKVHKKQRRTRRTGS